MTKWPSNLPIHTKSQHSGTERKRKKWTRQETSRKTSLRDSSSAITPHCNVCYQVQYFSFKKMNSKILMTHNYFYFGAGFSGQLDVVSASNFSVPFPARYHPLPILRSRKIIITQPIIFFLNLIDHFFLFRWPWKVIRWSITCRVFTANSSLSSL